MKQPHTIIKFIWCIYTRSTRRIHHI